MIRKRIRRRQVRKRHRQKWSVTARGYRDGRDWHNRTGGNGSLTEAVAAAQQAWSSIALRRRGKRRSWSVLLRDGRRYVAGFWRGANRRGHLLPIPLRGTAASVVYATCDANALRATLHTLRQLPLGERIVVLPSEASFQLVEAARAEPGIIAVYQLELANADGGRSLGGKLSTADTVLFVDGDNRATAAQLANFIWKCDRGMDVALNDVSVQSGVFRRRPNVLRLAEFLNRTLNRRELRANSLSALPYALSRRALQSIGPDKLAVPPHAYAVAILNKLNVDLAATAPSAIAHAARVPVHMAAEPAMVSGFAEAWRATMNSLGSRHSFPDMLRHREWLED